MKAALKRGFHFAATAEHKAAYIEATSIQEAEAIYKKVRQALHPAPTPEALPEDNQ